MNMDSLPPGVYIDERFPPSPALYRTGVPVFLGMVTGGDTNRTEVITNLLHFDTVFPETPIDGYLRAAVDGFFRCGGQVCYVLPLEAVNAAAIDAALAVLEMIDAFDLISAPDVMMAYARNDINAETVYDLQNRLLAHCEAMNNRFAILDAMPQTDFDTLYAQRRALAPQGMNGALYYPWVKVTNAGAWRQVPPSGHVAGIYTLTDYRVGVHKAPANERLIGVVDVARHLTLAELRMLNDVGVNCLRAMPNYGVRVWGAKTLSNRPEWMFVTVRRLVFKLRRWLEANTFSLVFEPHTPALWLTVQNLVTAYLNTLMESGEIQNFSVKCDAETNPPETYDMGIISTQISIAPSIPVEFIVVRVMHSESGIVITE